MVQAQYAIGNEYFIDGDIGWEINGGEVLRWLGSFHGQKVKFTVFSGGGSLFDAIAIYDYVKKHNIEVEANIYGFAASAATIIAGAAGAKNTYISPNSQYMIHWAFGGSESALKQANERVVEIYKQITGLPARRIKQLLDRGTDEDYFMGASETIELGFANEMKVEAIAASYKAKIQNLKNMSEEKTKPEEAPVKKRIINVSVLDAIKGSIEIDQDEIEDYLKGELENMMTENKELTAKVDDLESQVSESGIESKTAYTELENKFKEKETELENKANELKALEMTIEDLKSKAKESEDLIAELKKEPLTEKIVAEADEVQEPGTQVVEETNAREKSEGEKRWDMIREKHNNTFKNK